MGLSFLLLPDKIEIGYVVLRRDHNGIKRVSLARHRDNIATARLDTIKAVIPKSIRERRANPAVLVGQRHPGITDPASARRNHASADAYIGGCRTQMEDLHVVDRPSA